MQSTCGPNILCELGIWVLELNNEVFIDYGVDYLTKPVPNFAIIVFLIL